MPVRAAGAYPYPDSHPDSDRVTYRHPYANGGSFMDTKSCPVCDILRNSNGYPNGHSTFTYAHGYDGANPNSHVHSIRTTYQNPKHDTDPQLRPTGSGRDAGMHADTGNSPDDTCPDANCGVFNYGDQHTIGDHDRIYDPRPYTGRRDL